MILLIEIGFVGPKQLICLQEKQTNFGEQNEITSYDNETCTNSIELGFRLQSSNTNDRSSPQTDAKEFSSIIKRKQP